MPVVHLFARHLKNKTCNMSLNSLACVFNLVFGILPIFIPLFQVFKISFLLLAFMAKCVTFAENRKNEKVKDNFVHQTKFHTSMTSNYCSDFRYESNGIFVLGVGFFPSDKFRLFN